MYEHGQTYLGKLKKVGILNVIECNDIFYFNPQGSNDPFDGASSVKSFGKPSEKFNDASKDPS